MTHPMELERSLFKDEEREYSTAPDEALGVPPRGARTEAPRELPMRTVFDPPANHPLSPPAF